MSEDDIARKLEGAYRKLKGYYYYNRNFLPIRKKIVEFEYSSEEMQKAFHEMANVLTSPKKEKSKKYLENLYNQVDLYVLPKKFEIESPEGLDEEYPVSNIPNYEKVLTEVNFFIDAPVEIYIFDVLWALYLAKGAYEKKVTSHCIYGNVVRHDVISDDVDYDSNRFFKYFFYQYNNWRNGAFDALKENYKRKQDSVLISLDLKSYFYSVKLNFDKLDEILSACNEKKLAYILTCIQKNVFLRYKEKISQYRKDIKEFNKKHFPLPLGLFSSMILGNIYLEKFDQQVENTIPSFYGRYVDDLLIVYETDVNKNEKSSKIINRFFCQRNLLKKRGNEYILKLFPNLTIQKKKIKVICIKHDEPKTLIDVYDKTIRVIPSQANPLPIFDDELGLFEEKIYDIKNLASRNKIRDIEQIDISSFEIGRFFSSLLRTFSKIYRKNDSDTISPTQKDADSIEKNIQDNIYQIESFFSGSNCIEYYSYWIRYISFLMIVLRFYGPLDNEKIFGNVRSFYNKIDGAINNLSCKSLKKDLLRTNLELTRKIKSTLKLCLEVSLNSCLALDINSCKDFFNDFSESVKKYISANYFDDSLIPVPMANYFEYEKDISYLKMNMNMLGTISTDINQQNKMKWCPRFIHYDEVLLLLFYQRLRKGISNKKYLYTDVYAVQTYEKINHLKKKGALNIAAKSFYSKGYVLERVPISSRQYQPSQVDIGVASFEVKVNEKKPTDVWELHTYDYKKKINTVLKRMWENSESVRKVNKFGRPSILVMPELSIPFYWVKDIVGFCKKTQIALIAGLSYIEDGKKITHNYLLNIFPFFGRDCFGYPKAFVYIREKNDYSPIEFKSLSKVGKKCKNLNHAQYQVFFWKGLNIVSQVCFELTDVRARALLKGKCDLLAVPVYNPDTTYFSKIISSTARDLHCFIAQSNTSLYGDSRITGPYDRDSKDIVRLKGGVNDNVIIGTINLDKYREFQNVYEKKLSEEIESNKKSYFNNGFIEEEKQEKPNIKPFPARYKNGKIYL